MLRIEFEGGNLRKMMQDLDKFDDGLTTIDEGTWALPKSAKEKKAFKDIMKKPIPLGRDGDDASDKLYNIVGDDSLFDDLYDAGRKNQKVMQETLFANTQNALD